MKKDRVDLVLKYALAIAGREDPGNRELGPIHLLKYAYLADVAYADKNNGATYTEAPWRFHHFGPWALDVFNRIEPIVRDTGASERRFSSDKFEGEGVRWFLDDEHVLRSIENQLPFAVSTAVKRAVHSFGADTSGLLHHVYLTKPMLRAAPEDLLEFSAEDEGDVGDPEADKAPSKTSASVPDTGGEVSARARKRQKAMMQDLREKVRRRLLERSSGGKEIAPTPPPRYDDVFSSGQAWLDDSADDIRSESGELTFSNDVWKSRGRGEPGVP